MSLLLWCLCLLIIVQSESKCALVYGQMNEPPGARARVGLTGLTVAEHFRDAEGQDVLLFIDNIFRFTQVWIFQIVLASFCAVKFLWPLYYCSIHIVIHHLGQLRGVCFAWSYPICCRLPTNLGYRSWRSSRAYYNHQEGFNYLSPSYLRACWWLDRSCSCYHLCSLGCYNCVITTGLIVPCEVSVALMSLFHGLIQP